MEYVVLNNGVKMPKIGYGVIGLTDQGECERCMLDAMDAGYRLFDTAQGYGNERQVGNVIKKCGIPREELFITTKLWIAGYGYENAKESIEGSLERLQLDYIDLLLMHHPFNDLYGTWRAMSEFYKAGKIRAIGVSNLYPDRLVDFVKFNDIVPAVNQVEAHLFNQQVIAREYMDKYGVQIQAWAPLARGKNNLFEDETVKSIGDKYKKTNAQIALRFLVQSGITAVPKSTNKGRMIENMDVFDFELTSEEMEILAGLDKAESAFLSHQDPEQVERLVNWERTY